MVEGQRSLSEERFVKMVQANQGTLVRLCYVYLRDEDQARDAVQETFLKAYRSWNNFREDSSEKTWLTHIAINVCRDMCRSAWFKHVDRRITPEDLPPPALPVAPEDLELMCAVLSLPLRLREVVHLYYWQEMHQEDIGQMLGIRTSTVSVRLKQARDRLRVVLEGRYGHGRV